MEDFPAAHSMDTMWFAIDRDGHVAVFDTGEAGAVPTDGYSEHGFDHLEGIEELPESPVHLDPTGHLAGRYEDHVSLRDEYPLQDVLAFVTKVDEIEDLIAQLGDRVRPATRGVCLAFTAEDRDVFRALHERGACDGCVIDHGGDIEHPVGAHGLFHYTHPDGNAIASPYARRVVPDTPISAERVPASLREAAVRFEGRFAETAELQPAERWPCESWGPGWLASDHKTVRPFPGRAKEYAELVRDLRADDPGYVILDAPAEGEPPPPKKPWWKFW